MWKMAACVNFPLCMLQEIDTECTHEHTHVMSMGVRHYSSLLSCP
jgi:hypothetical protein